MAGTDAPLSKDLLPCLLAASLLLTGCNEQRNKAIAKIADECTGTARITAHVGLLVTADVECIWVKENKHE